MRPVAILTIVTGTIVGVVGAFVAGELWLGVGAVVATAGMAALWCIAIWKNPAEVFKAEAEVEAMASGYPPREPPQKQVSSPHTIVTPVSPPANDAQPTKH